MICEFASRGLGAGVTRYDCRTWTNGMNIGGYGLCRWAAKLPGFNVDMDENKSWMREEEERRSKLQVARVGLGWYG